MVAMKMRNDYGVNIRIRHKLAEVAQRAAAHIQNDFVPLALAT